LENTIKYVSFFKSRLKTILFFKNQNQTGAGEDVREEVDLVMLE